MKLSELPEGDELASAALDAWAMRRLRTRHAYVAPHIEPSTTNHPDSAALAPVR